MTVRRPGEARERQRRHRDDSICHLLHDGAAALQPEGEIVVAGTI